MNSGVAKTGRHYFYGIQGISPEDNAMKSSEVIKKIKDDASAIVLYLGVNGTGEYGDMNTLITELANKYTNKTIFVIQVSHVDPSKYTSGYANNNDIDTYNEKVKAHCEQISNAKFLEVASNVQDSNGILQNTSDGLHLISYQTWYDSIISAIKGSGGTTSNNSTSSNKSENNKNDNKNNSTSKKNNTSNKQKETTTAVNGDGYNEEYTSSAGITYKAYKQFEGSYSGNTYWSQGKTISSSGCGPTSVAILASGLVDPNITPAETAASMYARHGYTSAEYLKEEMDSRGMTSEIIWGPTAEEIQNNLKNGKVMLVSVNSNTIFTSGSHIMTIVDINEDGQVYISNSSSHTNHGWFDVSELLKGCDYIVVTDAGASGVASGTYRSNTSGYAAVVATWNQTSVNVTTNDPNVDVNQYNSMQYSMTSTTVNYRGMVDRYAMPFDFLWELLVAGEEKEFVFELADLVYNSDIQVTIYDNLTVNTNVETWNYEQECKTQTDIDISGSFQGYYKRKTELNHEDEPKSTPYLTTKTTVTTTNTINQVLTRANTWIVDYTNNYTYSEPTSTSSSNTINQDDQEFPSEPNSTGTSFSCDHIGSYKQEIINQIKASVDTYNKDLPETPEGSESPPTQIKFNSNNVVFSENYAVRYYYRYKNISEKIDSNIETKKFTEGTPNCKEKTSADTDKNGEPLELNFVTIFKKAEHATARKNILSITEWLFEMVEINGKPDLDLVKYLLYKATNVSYGVTEYDFSEFDASKFTGVTGLYGGSIQEKLWWALIDAGYSKVATAAVLGNIQWESGFDPTSIEKKYEIGLGLCQWSYDRRTQLEGYIAFKGTDTSDVQTQIEFLLGELNSNGGANGYASHQMGEPSSTAYDGRRYTKADWENETDIRTATTAFMTVFERPEYDMNKNHLANRIEDAQKYYNEFQDKEKPSTDSRIGQINLTGENAEKMSQMLTEALRIADDDRYYYTQDLTLRMSEFGYDCSSFVYRLYKQYFGIILGETTHGDYTSAATEIITDMNANNFQPGDVLWRSEHVAIYIGNGQYVHASNETNGIIVSTYNPASSTPFTKAFRYVK